MAKINFAKSAAKAVSVRTSNETTKSNKTKGVRTFEPLTVYVLPNKVRIADKALLAKMNYVSFGLAEVEGKTNLTLAHVTNETMAWAVANEGKNATVKTVKGTERENSLISVGRKVKDNGSVVVDAKYRNNLLKAIGIENPGKDTTYVFSVAETPIVTDYPYTDYSVVVAEFKKGVNIGKPARYGQKVVATEEYVLTLSRTIGAGEAVTVEADTNTTFKEVISEPIVATVKDTVSSLNEDDDFDPTKE